VNSFRRTYFTQIKHSCTGFDTRRKNRIPVKPRLSCDLLKKHVDYRPSAYPTLWKFAERQQPGRHMNPREGKENLDFGSFIKEWLEENRFIDPRGAENGVQWTLLKDSGVTPLLRGRNGRNIRNTRQNLIIRSTFDMQFLLTLQGNAGHPGNGTRHNPVTVAPTCHSD